MLGVAAFIGVGALLARWLPLSLFQASVLPIAATAAIALVVQAFMTMMHLQMHGDEDDDFDWDPEEDYGRETLLSTPNLPKIGKNVPCPWGSGHKFKNCCGKSTPK